MPVPSALSSATGAQRLVQPAALHLLDASSSWGATGAIRRVLSARHAALAGWGWQHTVMAPGARGPGAIDCGGLPLPWAAGERMPLGHARMVRSMVAARPHLIEVADPFTLAWAALSAGQRLHVPTVAFCHSNLPALAARMVGGAQGLATQRGQWAARRAQRYLVDLYAGFDLVLAPSKGMARRLLAWGVRHVQHQPLGVDCRIFNPQAADPRWRRRIADHLGVPLGTRLLLYTGRFAPEKNLDVLAHAVDLLGPGHLLVAVGSGPRPPRGERVRVLPAIRNSHHLARMLANADVYVHAGDREVYGLGALEAMACGLPMVVSAADGLGELARAGGLAVPGLRPADWAAAIAAALVSDQQQQRDDALAHARSLDWPHVLAQMVQRYQWLLRQDAHHRQASRASMPSDAAPLRAERPPLNLFGRS